MAVIFTGMSRNLITSVKISTRPKYPPVTTNWSTASRDPVFTYMQPENAVARAVATSTTGRDVVVGWMTEAAMFKLQPNSFTRDIRLPVESGQGFSSVSSIAMSGDGGRVFVGTAGIHILTKVNNVWTTTEKFAATPTYGTSITCMASGKKAMWGEPGFYANGTTEGRLIMFATYLEGQPGEFERIYGVAAPNRFGGNYGKAAALSGDGDVAIAIGGGDNLGEGWLHVMPTGDFLSLGGSGVRFFTGAATNFDGSVVAASGVRTNSGSTTGGRIFAYTKNETGNWVQQIIVPQADNNLTAMGDKIAMDHAGRTIVATGGDQAYVYQRAANSNYFGFARGLGVGCSAVAISGDGSTIVTTSKNSGLVSVFKAGA